MKDKSYASMICENTQIIWAENGWKAVTEYSRTVLAEFNSDIAIYNRKAMIEYGCIVIVNYN